MDFREIECFLAVADRLHFAKAAEDLYLGQSVVSESVRRLEISIGGRLFNRTTRKVSLTELGTWFYERVAAPYQDILEALEVAKDLAARAPEQLVVGFSRDRRDDVLQRVAILHHKCPNLFIDLRTMWTSDQLSALRADKIQVGVCWAPPIEPEFEYLRFGFSPFAAVLPDMLELQQPVTVANVVRSPVMLWPRHANLNLYDILVAGFESASASWTIAATPTEPESLISRVISGQGIGVAPSVSFDHRVPGVQIVNIADLPIVDCMVVWKKASKQPAAAVLGQLFHKTLAVDLSPAGVAAPFAGDAPIDTVDASR